VVGGQWSAWGAAGGFFCPALFDFSVFFGRSFWVLGLWFWSWGLESGGGFSWANFKKCTFLGF
jgi:hypothetical protein